MKGCCKFCVADDLWPCATRGGQVRCATGMYGPVHSFPTLRSSLGSVHLDLSCQGWRGKLEVGAVHHWNQNLFKVTDENTTVHPLEGIGILCIHFQGLKSLYSQVGCIYRRRINHQNNLQKQKKILLKLLPGEKLQLFKYQVVEKWVLRFTTRTKSKLMEAGCMTSLWAKTIKKRGG